ncbi:membrane metalloendopeptidase like 1 [Rhinolophus ferrumequinum]|uniref:Membrane metalloendopeptidase like 1 n=1 Tax=Rhinolophus ferrumequinum TaxID=59479 RepID=A0A7J7X603_RHIFE|nr:membrane metalloendopeptidase like 1 [Rhinolophus ferrumequinum]
MGKPESPMGMMEIAGPSGQKRPGFLEGVLLLLLLLVTGALVTLGVLYAHSRGKQLSLLTSRLCFSQEEEMAIERQPRAIKEPVKDEICTTPGCVIAAARILQNMDLSQEPCDDFYQYACGGWLWRHVIPETNSRYSVFDILRDKLEVILKGVLENSASKDRPAATVPQEERHDVTTLYHRMEVAELQNKFHLKGFNWTLFIQSVLSSVKIELLPDEEVVVYGIPYLQNLEEIIDIYSARTMQNYLVWRLVLDRISSLSQRFKDARANYRKALYGTTVEEVRWRECVSYVNSNMESAVGSLYVKEAFPRESKNVVRELIDKVRAVFVETLDELSWMDMASKKKAQEKAMSIREQIGYPDYILEERNKHLDEEYSNLNFSEDLYFENGLQNLKAGAQRSLKKLREKVDQNLWIIGAAVVNAFYSPNRNQIVFPAGILQPPFFSKEQPQALNFGGIGMVIGHEITHGFDDNGRNFDKDGNMLDWWSNFSAQHFRKQSECMVYQYANYSWDLAEGQNVNGFSTLGENIADNGGVRQAYKAYRKWVADGGKNQQLPGLKMTYDQLFFINYAQVWCGSYRPEFAVQSIKTDVHSPLKYRVLGSLQNLAAFAKAFHCARGTPMHPQVRCRVW